MCCVRDFSVVSLLFSIFFFFYCSWRFSLIEIFFGRFVRFVSFRCVCEVSSKCKSVPLPDKRLSRVNSVNWHCVGAFSLWIVIQMWRGREWALSFFWGATVGGVAVVVSVVVAATVVWCC